MHGSEGFSMLSIINNVPAVGAWYHEVLVRDPIVLLFMPG